MLQVSGQGGIVAAAAIGAVGAALALLQPAAAEAQTFRVTNLVSDGAVAARTIDPSLINPWGVSYSPTGPLWVSDNNSGVTTLYTGAGKKVPLTVTIPPPAGQTFAAAPTGQVFNGNHNEFQVSAGGKTGSAAFIFATEDGTISGWAPSVNFGSAVLAVDNSAGGAGAVYKGLTMGSTGGSDFLYAANFRGGDVEMYNNSFGLVNTFTDPNVAAGYAPFNVADLNGTLYVTYALQDAAKHDDVAGPGNGYVDAFSLNGTFERRIVSVGGQVNSPWGLDIAPTTFGKLAGDLLVGNFGDGTISAFNPTTGAFAGSLMGVGGAPLVEGDLWALVNGNGGSGGDADKVYFTSGISGEAHGLLGSITAVPEPATWALMLIGIGGLGATLRRRRSAPQTAAAAVA